MKKWSLLNRFMRFAYQQVFLRLSGQIREPYLIRVDRIYNNPSTSELSVAFHIANKRISQDATVTEFVKENMIYLTDPRVVFDMGQQFGAHSEQLSLQEKSILP